MEGWVGPKACLAIFGEQNNFLALLRIEPQTIQSLWLQHSHYTDYAALAPITWGLRTIPRPAICGKTEWH
jgi:hypothetical protein